MFSSISKTCGIYNQKYRWYFTLQQYDATYHAKLFVLFTYSVYTFN